jgi:hypothetical protein
MNKNIISMAMIAAVYCLAPVAALADLNDPAGDEWDIILQHCKVDHAIAQRCMKEATDAKLYNAASGTVTKTIATTDATTKLVKAQIDKDELQVATAQHLVLKAAQMGN